MSISRRFKRKPLQLSKLDKMVERIAKEDAQKKEWKLNQAHARAERAMKKMEKNMDRIKRNYPMIGVKIEEAIEAENGSSISSRDIEQEIHEATLQSRANQRASQDRRLSNDDLYALANEERRISQRRCDNQ